MTKPPSKKEIKSRQLEENRKINKKRDFRKFANQMFKDPTAHLPLVGSGMGDGTTAYCYDCRMSATRVVIKEDKKIICKTCDGNNVEFREKCPSFFKKLCWAYKQFIYERRNKK